MDASRPRVAFVPTRHYAVLLDVLEARGHRRDALLAHAGLDASVFASEHGHLTLEEVERLVGRACALENTDALGLEVGQRLQLMSHGSLSVAALTAPTVREAVETVVRFFALVSPLFSLELRRGEAKTAVRLSVRWPIDHEVERFHTATMSGSLYAQLRFLLGGTLPPGVELDARHPRPPGLPPWVDEIDVTIRFDRPRYELRLPSSILDVRLPLADPRAHESARRTCAAELAARPDPSRFSAAVERALRESGPPFPDLDATSRLLGISSRSLRRKLAEEGTSFREILAVVRLATADVWLADPKRSITEIGLALGYADAANFTRAYRRARGTSPSEIRSGRAASLAASRDGASS
ncbi:MAG: AraC family transcriptional regulator [Myxococcales bacterium]|nr:AraC family transcriptional regulator [Myxococcales bacterium]